MTRWVYFFVVLFSGSAFGATPEADGVAFFESSVRPLLVEHCYECHSTSSKIVQGGLLLDSKPGIEKGGDSGAAIVPGDAAKSLLVRAIRYSDDEDVQMPPKGKLDDQQIAVLTRWVELGAPDPRTTAAAAPAKRVVNLEEERKHWAYQPLRSVKPPKVSNKAWSRTPIDRFIAHAFDEHKLHGNPVADRRTLIRRAYFDLLGLPPTPEQLAEALADESPDAYERLIERLLDSPQYGERWARHWLDLARFAESHGYEQDYDRPYAYHYRDFVIRALNQDLPYDTFVRWQIAGDELAPHDPLALAATGFLGAGVHATQITANQAEKERYDELDDMVKTIGTTMLGLTIGCARCHDHKYDAIPAADYYRIASIFTTTVRSDQLVNQDEQAYAAAMKQFDKRHKPHFDKRTNYERKLAKQFDAWLEEEAASSELPRWTVLEPDAFGGDGVFTRLDDASLRCGDSNKFLANAITLSATVDAENLRVVRLDALADSMSPVGGPGLRDDGSFELNDLRVTATSADGKKTQTVKFASSWSTTGTLSGAAKDKKGANNGWKIDAKGAGRNQSAGYVAEKPFGFGPGTRLLFTLGYRTHLDAIGRVRFAVSSDSDDTTFNGPHLLASSRRFIEQYRAAPTKKLDAKTRAALVTLHRQQDAGWQKREARVQESLATQPPAPLARMMICSEGVPAVRLHTQGHDFYEKTFILKRGDPNQKVEEAAPGYLQALINAPEKERHWQHASADDSGLSYRRTALADWLTDTRYGAGHLLARVVVNRLWYYHMGRGLVATPSDFGVNGERPSHPELLDWLAGELIKNGRQLKLIHKLIMTSAVYMQTSAADKTRSKVDVDNRYFWHRPMQRLEAEAIRDTVLAVSGKLDERMFGPGTLDPKQPRRSIYFFVKRSKLVPMMMLFDAPDTLQDLAVRSETTIAPQSLMLMNSEILRTYAAAMADRILPAKPDDDISAIRRAYLLALSREPTDAEIRVSVVFVDQQLAGYNAEKRNDATQLAWTDFCQVLFCLNEFIYIQ